ncbi:RecX family transcriptional regulator, partial [bacterium]|nr:RecX family transcriptional regulator [bacterium]
RWVGPDGPWRKLICEILDELEPEIEAIRDESDFDQMAVNLVKQKLKNISVPSPNDKKRLWSLLKRHGFESSSINAAISKINFTEE